MTRRIAALLLAAVVLGTLVPPVLAAGHAEDDEYSVDEDVTLTTTPNGSVLLNDEPDASGVTAELATGPGHATSFTLDADGTFSYTPEPDFNGIDTFTYRTRDALDELSNVAIATITVDPVNDAPVALDAPALACNPGSFGGSFPIPEDAGLFVLLPGNCAVHGTDVDVGDTLAWELVDDASHGVATVDSDGFASYTPDADYNTPEGDWLSDSFTFRASDGVAFSDPATMRIWVAPINDAPSFTNGTALVEVDEDSGAYGATWATDVIPGPANESGQAVSFDVEVRPGDFQAFSVQPAISSNGTLTFTPAANAVWLAEVTVVAHDDGGLARYLNPQLEPDDTSNPAVFEIAIGAVDDAPVATNDALAATEDAGVVVIDPRINDSDADGNSLAVTAVTQGVKGSAAFTSGSVRYTPAANAFGTDSFTYTINDGTGRTDTATVNVTITAINDPPTIGQPWRLFAFEDAGPTIRKVRTIISAGPGEGTQTLSAQEMTNSNAQLFGSQPVITVTPNGLTVAFTPAANRNGRAVITFVIKDNGGTANGGNDTSVERFFVITVAPVNDPPNAVNDLSFSVPRNAGATALAVLANDTAAPDSGETLTITAKTNGGHGTVAITGGGTGLTYKPATGFSGTDTFTYTISDSRGLFDTATVLVTVRP